MRIGSAAMTLNYVNRLNNAYKNQANLVEQGDGNKFHRPSDDPVEYARTMRYKNDFSSNERYTRNVTDGISWMKASDTKMQEMVGIMSTIKEKTEAAANETNNETDLTAIAAEVEALIEELVNLANTNLGGRYLFSGQRDTVQPYLVGSQEITRADIKTLDETQTRIFGYAFGEHGDIYQTKSNRMLKLADENGNEYYMNPADGAIFTKEFVESGYKEVLANKELNGKDLYQYIYDNHSLGQFKSESTSSLSSKVDTTIEDVTAKDFITTDSNGKTVTKDGQTGITITTNNTGGTVSQDVNTNYKYTDKQGNVITVSFDVINGAMGVPTISAVNKNGAAINYLTDTNVSLNPAPTQTANGFSFKIEERDANGVVVETRDVSLEVNPNPPKANKFTYTTANGETLEVPTYLLNNSPSEMPSMDFLAAADGNGNPISWRDFFDVTYANGAITVKDKAGNVLTPTATSQEDIHQVTIKDNDYSSTLNLYRDRNETVKENTIKVDNKNFFAKNQDKSQNTICDLNGQIRDADNTFAFTAQDGTNLKLSFTTAEQKIVTYLGDNNKISMKMIDGANDPSKDAINATGVDVFGTDLFNMDGTSVLNDLYSIVQHMKKNDTKWLSADGMALADQSYTQVLQAETELGAICANYTTSQEMLENQGTLITEDITNLSGTDVAELAVQLQMASMIYSMSLSMGSKILQNSLADYL